MKTGRLGLVAGLLLLAGCSASPQSESPDEDSFGDLDVSVASTAQAAEIDDGVATADEYSAAFQRYRECLSAAGFEMTYADLSGVVYDYGVPAAAVDDGVEGDCYDAEFRFVDMLWQSAQAAKSDSDNAQFYRECLQDHGIEPADSVGEMNEQMREAGIEALDCLS